MAGISKPAKRKDLCRSKRIVVIEKLEKKATLNMTKFFSAISKTFWSVTKKTQG